MFKIHVYHGTDHIRYESQIIPMVGDVYAGIDEWGGKHFKVVRRLLCTTYPENVDLISIIVEPIN